MKSNSIFLHCVRMQHMNLLSQTVPLILFSYAIKKSELALFTSSINTTSGARGHYLSIKSDICFMCFWRCGQWSEQEHHCLPKTGLDRYTASF